MSLARTPLEVRRIRLLSEARHRGGPVHGSWLLRHALPALDTTANNALALKAKEGDRRALDELCRRTMRMVVQIVGYVARRHPYVYDDTLAAAVGVGLMAALERWSVDAGAFSTCFWWSALTQGKHWFALAVGAPQISTTRFRETAQRAERTWVPFDVAFPLLRRDEDEWTRREPVAQQTSPDDAVQFIWVAQVLATSGLSEMAIDCLLETEPAHVLAERYGVTRQRCNQIKLQLLEWLRARAAGDRSPPPRIRRNKRRSQQVQP